MLQWLVRFVVPIVVPGAVAFAMLGGLFGGLAIVMWWAFLSRAPWTERVGAIVLMIAGLAATSRFLHVSITTGAIGMLFLLSAVPVLSLAFVVWAVASRRCSNGVRRVSTVVTILLACGAWTLLRTSGVTGDYHSHFQWRWAKTPEERLLARAGEEPTARSAAPAGAKTDADWPGFRGPGRDGIIRGVRIDTDRSTSPPVELWRRPIGPGWSSFAVRGDRLYTQEQRGEDEIVACYKVTPGEPVWRHRDAARFWESNAGAGPRATPTLGNGRLYAFGATGIVNALDAGNGAVVWSRNAAPDTGKKVPGWGFASSPLVVGDVVIVAAAGKLAAYDLATGHPRRSGPASGMSYNSPHRMTIDGVAQILLVNGGGATSVAPADGTLLWEHRWPGGSIVQPALTADGDVLLVRNGQEMAAFRLSLAGGLRGRLRGHRGCRPTWYMQWTAGFRSCLVSEVIDPPPVMSIVRRMTYDEVRKAVNGKLRESGHLWTSAVWDWTCLHKRPRGATRNATAKGGFKGCLAGNDRANRSGSRPVPAPDRRWRLSDLSRFPMAL